MKKIFFSLLLLISQANAATFNLIFSSGPGSGSDQSLNAYIPCLRDQDIIVTKEFKPGAEGLVAIKALQNSVDSNSTTNILIGNVGINVLGRYKDINLLTDLKPITYTNSIQLVIVAAKKTSISDLKALNRPINIGSSSSSGTFIAEKTFSALNIPYNIIMYRNSSNSLTDLKNGSIDLAIDTLQGSISLIETGLLSAMFSTGNYKDAIHLSDVVPILKKLQLGLIISAKSDINKTNIEKVYKIFDNCNKREDVKQALAKLYSEPILGITTDDILETIRIVRADQKL